MAQQIVWRFERSESQILSTTLNSTSLSDEGIQEVLLFGSHNSRCVLRGVDRRGNGITVICAFEDVIGRILEQQPFAVLTVLCELMKAKMLVVYFILDSIRRKVEFYLSIKTLTVI